jgi:hypothetical protein
VGKRGIRFHREAVEAYMRQGSVNAPEHEACGERGTPRRRKVKLTSAHSLW